MALEPKKKKAKHEDSNLSVGGTDFFSVYNALQSSQISPQFTLTALIFRF